MDTDADRILLIGEGMTAAVKPLGAELCSLRTVSGCELIWQAGPAWRRHAPLLFPIVGRLAGDALRHKGRTTRLTQHGFARDRVFTVTKRTASSCTLTLVDDDETRAMFPFAFRLAVRYRLNGDMLTTDYRLENTAATDLLASLGAHPAFRWPLVDGIAKDAHRLVFECAEPEPLLQLKDGLIASERVASPLDGRALGLSDALFARDALIFERPASRRVRYEASGTEMAVEVAWDGFTELGVWSKPADFICIEPWSGLSDRSGFDGDWAEKPGLIRVTPGSAATRSLTVRACGPV